MIFLVPLSKKVAKWIIATKSIAPAPAGSPHAPKTHIPEDLIYVKIAEDILSTKFLTKLIGAEPIVLLSFFRIA